MKSAKKAVKKAVKKARKAVRRPVRKKVAKRRVAKASAKKASEGALGSPRGRKGPLGPAGKALGHSLSVLGAAPCSGSTARARG